MATNCKATIVFGDVKIILEGPKDFIEQQVERYSVGPSPSKKLTKNLTAVPDGGAGESAAIGELGLIADKRPKGHAETIAVLAFCLTEAGHSEFNEDDMRRAYIRAAVRPPKVMSQALRDAKNLRDFLEPLGKGRYRLSPHGERTVRFDLPRSGGDE